MSQLSYSQNFAPAIAGDIIYPFAPRTVLTYANPTETIEWAKGVVVNTSGENVTLPATSGDTFAGVALRDTSVEGTNYALNSAVSVMKRGQIPVVVEQAVTTASSVYVRYAPRAQVQTLNFSGNFVTGNSIALTVNGVALTPVPFNTDNATTVADLAAAIQATAPVATATGTGANQITATAVVDGDEVAFTGFLVTGGASQPTVTITETVVHRLTIDRGNFRADADSSTALLVSGAKYMGDASAGDLVILDLNIP